MYSRWRSVRLGLVSDLIDPSQSATQLYILKIKLFVNEIETFSSNGANAQIAGLSVHLLMCFVECTVVSQWPHNYVSALVLSIWLLYFAITILL